LRVCRQEREITADAQNEKTLTMTILYFGVFEKPFDTEVYVSNTLESMGHTVIRKQVNEVNPTQLEALLKEKYDFILLSKSWFQGDTTRCKFALKQCPTLRVGWFWDLCWGTNREHLVFDHPLFDADLVFTTDGGNQESFARIGVNHSVLRQGIYEPEAVLGNVRQEYRYDVIFVGTDVHSNAFNWSYRGTLLTFLKNTYGPRFKHFGKGKEIRNQELNDLYASAKVVVGDSVVRPKYWSNRIYETLGRGGFLIFPEIEGMNDFEKYKHYIPYKIGDFEGLKEKIDYFIFHDKERDDIRMAGFEHCRANHTYTIRCKELVERINEYKTAHNNPNI